MDIRIHRSTDREVVSGKAVAGDIDITTGDLILASGNESVAQHVLIRLRLFAGEWFLDTRVGLPYYDQVLIKSPDNKAVRAIITQAILTTPGIEALESFEMDFDGVTRTMSVSFVARLTNSTDPLVFDEELIIDV